MTKNILITGNTSGVGLELSKLYEADGYNVIGLSRSQGYDLENVDSVLNFCADHQFTFFDKVILNAATAGIEYGRERLNNNYNYWSKMMRVNCINQTILLNMIRARVKEKVAFISSESALYPRMLAREKFDSFQKLAYKTTKISMNMCAMYFSREFQERGWEVPVVIYSPGSVDTNFDKQYTIEKSGRIKAEESALGIKTHFDQSTMNNNGKFYRYDGTELNW